MTSVAIIPGPSSSAARLPDSPHTYAAAAAASAVAVPSIAKSKASANDRIRVGLLGLGGRMGPHVHALAQMAKENVEVVAACDCDRNKLESASERYPDLKGNRLR